MLTKFKNKRIIFCDSCRYIHSQGDTAMKVHYILPVLLLLLSFNLCSFGQYREQHLIGSWKHYDVINHVGAHITIELEPFDLTLSKNHRFEMTGTGMVSTGSWSLKNDLLLLHVEPTADRDAREQKLYINKLTTDVLTVEIKEFNVPGGLLIVMNRKK
jgi:hypothetical protein